MFLFIANNASKHTKVSWNIFVDALARKGLQKIRKDVHAIISVYQTDECLDTLNISFIDDFGFGINCSVFYLRLFCNMQIMETEDYSYETRRALLPLLKALTAHLFMRHVTRNPVLLPCLTLIFHCALCI